MGAQINGLRSKVLICKESEKTMDGLFTTSSNIVILKHHGSAISEQFRGSLCNG